MALDPFIPGGLKPGFVWGTSFAGVTLGTPTATGGGARDWNTSIDGADTITGSTFGVGTDARLAGFFGPSAYVRLQQINGSNQPIPADLTEFNTYFDNEINTSTSLIPIPGAGELSLNNLIATDGTYPSQSPLMLKRTSPSAYNYPITEDYWTFVVQFPVGLDLNAPLEYLAFFEKKEGGLDTSLIALVDNGTYRDGRSCSSTTANADCGTIRLVLDLNGVNGISNEIRVKLDNRANNSGVTLPSGRWTEEGYVKKYENGDPMPDGTVFSHLLINSGMSAPLGVPLRFHVYHKIPPTPLYQDRNKGILKVMMENLATNEMHMLADVENSFTYQLSSTYNGQMTRYFPTHYCSEGNRVVKFTNIEVWKKPPVSF